jgi:hypothetical protein
LAAAFAEDAQRWLAAGIDTVPDFSTTGSAYEPSDSGELTILVAPLFATIDRQFHRLATLEHRRTES